MTMQAPHTSAGSLTGSTGAEAGPGFAIVRLAAVRLLDARA
jgi:hypothetical protein